MKSLYKFFFLFFFASLLTTTFASSANSYNIDSEEPDAKATFEYKAISPEPGEVYELPTEITVKFDDVIGYLSSNKLPVYRDGKPVGTVSGVISSDNNKEIVFSISYKSSELGEYSFKVPAQYIHNIWYGDEDFSEFDEYNPEFTISYNFITKSPDEGNEPAQTNPELLEKVQELLKYTGAGFPSLDSESRIALSNIIKSESVVSDEDILHTISAFYNETNVELPNPDSWYRISSVNSTGDILYLAYLEDQIVLDPDSTHASAFIVGKGIAENTLTFSLIDGHFLHVLTDGGSYSGTSSSNVTSTYNSLVNDLTLSKFVIGEDSLATFGKLSIMGSLGTSRKGEVSKGNYSMVDFSQRQGFSVKFEELELSDKFSAAFCFTPTSEPQKPLLEDDVKYVLSANEINSFDIPLLLSLDVESEVSLAEEAKATMVDSKGTTVASIVIENTNKTGAFSLPLKGLNLVNGTYKLVIPSNTFFYEIHGIKLTAKEISINIVVDIPEPIEEAVCVFHEDFEKGIPLSFKLYDFDKASADPNLHFESKTWDAIVDPLDSKNKLAAAASWLQGKVQANDWMVTPVIKLPEDKSACNLFWRSRSAYNTYRDSYKVYINTNPSNGSDFNLENWTILEDFPITENPATWKFHSKDLSQYAGKDVQIAFVQNSLDCWMIFIDDIYVGNKTCLDPGYIRIESDTIAFNGKGVVNLNVKAGIRDEIKSFMVRLTTPGGEVTEQFKDVNLSPSSLTSYQLKQTVNGEEGLTTEFAVELVVNGVTVSSDDSRFIYAVSLSPDSIGDFAVSHRTVGEIMMERESSFAPQGYEADRHATSAYPESLIMLNYHTGLSEKYNEQGAAIQTYAEQQLKKNTMVWARDIIVDNIAIGEAYKDLDSLYMLRNQVPAFAKVMMDKCTCDKDTIELKGTIAFALSSSVKPCSYMFAIVEDSVSSTLYNRYSRGGYGGFLNYAADSTYVGCQFDNVVRAISKISPISEVYEAGDSVHVNYGILIKNLSDYNDLFKLKAVLLVRDNATGEILNANRCHFSYSDEVLTAIESTDDESAYLSNNTLYVGQPSMVNVYDLSGRLLFSQKIDERLDLKTVVNNRIVVVKVMSDKIATFKTLVK